MEPDGDRPTPLLLASFWGVAFVVLASGAAGLSRVLGRPEWTDFGLGFGALVVALGLLSRRVGVAAYAAWRRINKQVLRVERLAITLVCYYVLLVPIGLLGSRLALRPPTGRQDSWWTPRSTFAPSSYAHQYDSPRPAATERSWVAAYLRWAIESGNAWTICLLPFLALLAVFTPEERHDVPHTIYTLF